MSLLDTLPIWCAVNALHRLRRRYVGPGFVLRLLSPRRREEARRPSTRSAAPWRAHVAVDRTGAARAVPQEPLAGAPSMNSSLPAPPGSLPSGLWIAVPGGSAGLGEAICRLDRKSVE